MFKHYFISLSLALCGSQLFAAQPSLVVIAPKEAAQSVPAAKNKQPKTALGQAAGDGDLKLVKALVQQGANVNEKGKGGDTPLHYAGKYGRTYVTLFLLESKADKTIPNDKKQTPLMAAQARKEFDEKNALQLAGKEKAEHEQQIKNVATTIEMLKAQSPAEVDAAIAKNPDEIEPVSRKTALMRAVEEDDIPMMKNLFARNVNVNAQDITGLTALHLAAFNGRAAAAALLMAHGANKNLPDANKVTPLRLAESLQSKALKEASKDSPQKAKNFEGVIKVLTKNHVQEQPRARAQSMAITHAAAAAGSNGFAQNVVNKALFDAAESGTLDELKKFASAKENFDAQDSEGNTILHVALKKRRPDDIIAFIIKTMSGLDKANAEGNTPLHVAAQTINLYAAEMLIDSLADRAPTNKIGQKPLHIAQIALIKPKPTEENAKKIQAMIDYLARKEKEVAKQ